MSVKGPSSGRTCELGSSVRKENHHGATDCSSGRASRRALRVGSRGIRYCAQEQLNHLPAKCATEGSVVQKAHRSGSRRRKREASLRAELGPTGQFKQGHFWPDD